MITIKKFSEICNCNAKTLRYYDSIDLLKPAMVDEDSGYRYYQPDQAFDFIKIRNLQAADFSIDEIKTLLKLEDDQILKAFDEKIISQKQKMNRILEIRESYQKQKMNLIEVLNRMTNLDSTELEKYGLCAEEEYDELSKINQEMKKESCFMEDLVRDSEEGNEASYVFEKGRGYRRIEGKEETEEYRKIFETVGFDDASEIMDDLKETLNGMHDCRLLIRVSAGQTSDLNIYAFMKRIVNDLGEVEDRNIRIEFCFEIEEDSRRNRVSVYRKD